jgi:hypothetical protein
VVADLPAPQPLTNRLTNTMLSAQQALTCFPAPIVSSVVADSRICRLESWRARNPSRAEYISHLAKLKERP